MEPVLFITFVVASITLIVIPGPNVLVVVSTSISHGTKRGLQTVFGTSSAMVIQLIIAAVGTTWLVQSIAEGLVWLKWFGVAYLAFIGVSQLKSLTAKKDIEKRSTATGTFSRGFIVSLSNPKTLLFFGAFLPQFVSPRGEYLNQIVILSATFLLLAALLDGIYAIIAGHMRGLIQRPYLHKFQTGVSGLVYLGVGAWLAAIRNS